MGMVINGILSTGSASSVPRNLRAVGRLLLEKKMFFYWQERARAFWSPIHLLSMSNHFVKERDDLIVPWRFPLSAYLTFPSHWWIGKIFQPRRDGALRMWVGMQSWSNRTSLCSSDVNVCYWQKGLAARCSTTFLTCEGAKWKLLRYFPHHLKDSPSHLLHIDKWNEISLTNFG